MNTGKTIIILVVVIFMLGGAFFIMGFLNAQKEPPPEQKHKEKAMAVRVANVEYSDVIALVMSSGRLGSQHYIDLMTEVPGRILAGKAALKKGQNFKKGDVLFKIFDQEMKYSLKASKSRFLNLIANALPDLKIDYPKSFTKWKAFFDAIDIDESLPEMPQIQTDNEKTFLAGRNILNDYYTIKSAEIRLEKYTVYAPFDGSFSAVYLELGSIANTGSRVARIIRTDILELEVPVEVEDVRWIETGDEVDVFSEDGNERWLGTVARESDYVDPTTQSVSVFIKLKPSRENPLFEGQYLKAIFGGKHVSSAMEIPRRAVFNTNEIFVVRNGELYKEKIKVHKVNPKTIIFSGVSEGETIVIEPLVNIPEKAKVETIFTQLDQ
jgi:multidrug efflux pump subunit AcrA (membrane-fusion protein)